MASRKNTKRHGKEERGEEEFKFPRTRHLFDAGGEAVARDDLVMEALEAGRWYSTELVVEEKVDGANLGITFDAESGKYQFKNRSHWVTSASASQFRTLDAWLESHRGELWEIFSKEKDIILFGEWLYARHSIRYTQLPDLFLAFDVYDKKTKRFFTIKERDDLLRNTTINTVRQIAKGIFSKEELKAMLQLPSHYYDGPVEGVYLRLEREEGREPERAKVVRPDFLQSEAMEKHWSKNQLIKNIVLF